MTTAFGANNSHFDKTIWDDLGLSQITMTTYWALNPTMDLLEPLAGSYKALGLHVIGHPVIYALQSQPDWPDNRTGPEEKCARLKKYLDALSKHISVADIVNEPMHNPTLIDGELYAYAAGYSTVERRVNEYGILTGEADAFIALLRGNGHLYERIGVQWHVMAPEAQLPPIGYMLDAMKRVRDHFGKPIDLSEGGVPSGTMGWTEASQANYTYRFVRAFKDSGVESINWWDLRDTEAVNFNPTSGLIRADGSLKPAYAAFKAAIQGKPWTKLEEPKPVKKPWYCPFMPWRKECKG